MSRLVGLCGCLFLGLGCVTAPAPVATPLGAVGPKARELFPLAVGNRWTYDVAFQGAKQTLTLSITSNEGSTFIDSRGEKFILDQEGLRDDRRYLLKDPLAIDAKWSSIIDVSTTEDYKVVNVGEAVDVPAGHFDGCVRVEARSPQAPGSALIAVQVYCPGVGLTRLVTYHEQNGDRGQVQWKQELSSFHLAGHPAGAEPVSSSN